MANLHWLKLGIAGTLIAVASWSIFGMFNDGLTYLAERIGISNPYLINIAIVLFVVIILLVFGYSFKKTLKKALK